MRLTVGSDDERCISRPAVSVTRPEDREPYDEEQETAFDGTNHLGKPAGCNRTELSLANAPERFVSELDTFQVAIRRHSYQQLILD